MQFILEVRTTVVFDYHFVKHGSNVVKQDYDNRIGTKVCLNISPFQIVYRGIQKVGFSISNSRQSDRIHDHNRNEGSLRGKSKLG